MITYYKRLCYMHRLPIHIYFFLQTCQCVSCTHTHARCLFTVIRGLLHVIALGVTVVVFLYNVTISYLTEVKPRDNRIPHICFQFGCNNFQKCRQYIKRSKQNERTSENLSSCLHSVLQSLCLIPGLRVTPTLYCILTSHSPFNDLQSGFLDFHHSGELSANCPSQDLCAE